MITAVEFRANRATDDIEPGMGDSRLKWFECRMTSSRVDCYDVLFRDVIGDQRLGLSQLVMGQLYLAVLVARLVGLHISHETALNRDPGNRCGSGARLR